MIEKKIELILSITAIVVSFFAAALSLWQLDVSRTHNRLSVKPLINVVPFLEGEKGRNGIYLSNQGLGPAIVTSMKVTFDGTVYEGLGENKWPKILEAAGANPLCYKLGWPLENTMLKTDAEELLLAPTAANLPLCKLEAYKLILETDFAIEIKYESLYEEVYTFSGSSKMNRSF